MNFLGLLCKVRGGQGETFRMQERSHLMGYWDELEIFRCADGCQKLATKWPQRSRTDTAPRSELTAVTHINTLQGGVRLGFKGCQA